MPAPQPPAASSFRPAWWLRGAHAQTICGALFRPVPNPTLHRQQLELPDGDLLELDWSASSADTSRPLVLILHGLEGSSRSGYVRGLISALEQHGMAALVMHFRGCGGRVNRLERTYHSGETGDPALVLKWLRQHWPQRAIASVGYSLGGNVLLKLLGEAQSRSPVDVAVAVCVPMDLAVCATRMEQGASKVYLRRLVRQLKRKIIAKFRQRPNSRLDLSAVARCRGFWDFDDIVTAPLHGFSSAQDYYDKSSARRFLQHIVTPTLILHARDDPFMTDDVLPSSEQPLPESVCIEISERGGHVGFIAGRGPLGLIPTAWLERRIAEHLAARLVERRAGPSHIAAQR